LINTVDREYPSYLSNGRENMSRYRGMKINGITRFKGNINLRRSIDLRELADFGSIVDNTSDLPTAGAVHRGDLASKSATREYTDLSTVVDMVVVDTQDMGSITETARDSSDLNYNNITYKY
jgi:hypothetical protein